MDIEFKFGITLGTGLHRPERAVVGRSYPGVSSHNRAAGAMEHMGAAALLKLHVTRVALKSAARCSDNLYAAASAQSCDLLRTFYSHFWAGMTRDRSPAFR